MDRVLVLPLSRKTECGFTMRNRTRPGLTRPSRIPLSGVTTVGGTTSNNPSAHSARKVDGSGARPTQAETRQRAGAAWRRFARTRAKASSARRARSRRCSRAVRSTSSTLVDLSGAAADGMSPHTCNTASATAPAGTSGNSAYNRRISAFRRLARASGLASATVMRPWVPRPRDATPAIESFDRNRQVKSSGTGPPRLQSRRTARPVRGEHTPHGMRCHRPSSRTRVRSPVRAVPLSLVRRRRLRRLACLSHSDGCQQPRPVQQPTGVLCRLLGHGRFRLVVVPAAHACSIVSMTSSVASGCRRSCARYARFDQL
jgi:hypothetical protein